MTRNRPDNTATHRVLFAAASMLTDLFPAAGARFLDAAVSSILGSRHVVGRCTRENRSRLQRVGTPGRILVVGDLNIGDAVNLQAAVRALREYFPAAEIDYAISRRAGDLVAGNPDISGLFPVFGGSYLPGDEDLRALERLARAARYDIIFNFCPLFEGQKVFGGHPAVIEYLGLAAALAANERRPGECNHIVFRAYRFIHDLFGPFLRPSAASRFDGVDVTLSDEAAARAQEFLAARRIDGEEPVVMYNPDASSPYTRLPERLQTELLRRIAALGCTILLGAGHNVRGIEDRLVRALPEDARDRAVVVPASVPIDAYAALVDRADVYITGDTGPLHIAAARKRSRSGGTAFRNRTSVVALFGATPVRMYGYGSRERGLFPANQAAPAFTYAGGAPCRNITCVNKMAKKCRSIRCFDGLPAGRIIDDIGSVLSSRRVSSSPASARRSHHTDTVAQ